MLNIDNSVIVFDLDDTLYKECDYVISGTKAVLQLLIETDIILKIQADSFLQEFDCTTELIDKLCRHFKFNDKLKETLIWCYRLHRPHIQLDNGAVQSIKWAQKHAKAIAIITDGRSITQRLKLRALGLSHLMAYISDDHVNGKPDPEMFLKVEANWPGCNYYYVADNAAKDFIAPNSLGWVTVGLLDDGRNIKRTTTLGNSGNYMNQQPLNWITDLCKLPNIISTNIV
jgi:putative hydrolase of the HAD superfamily